MKLGDLKRSLNFLEILATVAKVATGKCGITSGKRDKRSVVQNGAEKRERRSANDRQISRNAARNGRRYAWIKVNQKLEISGEVWEYDRR